MQHDRALFDELVAEARVIQPELRSGSMFGCPALFFGRRLVACVYGEGIGLKVQADVAATALAQGGATAFRPYGKTTMRQWVQIDGGKAGLKARRYLIAAAVAFAEAASDSEPLRKPTVRKR